MLSSQNPSSSSDPADLPGRVVCLHVERNLSPADIAAHLALPLAHILAILESPSARELADTIRRIHAQFAPLRAAQARLDALHRTYRIATTDPSDARRLRACIALIEGRTLPEPQPRQRGAGGPPASNRGEVGRHSPSVAASAPRVDDCDALMSDPAAIAPSAPLSASTDRAPLPANPLAVSHDPIAHTAPSLAIEARRAVSSLPPARAGGKPSGSTPRPHAFARHTCVSLRARDAPPPILSRAA